MADDDQAVDELAQRGRDFVMSRLGILPADVGTNQDAALALFVVARSVGCFYVDRAEESYLVVLINTQHGPVLVSRIHDAGELTERIATSPQLSTVEIDEVLDELAASQVTR